MKRQVEDHQHDDDSVFESAAADLEKAIAVEEEVTHPGPEDIAKAIKEGIETAVGRLTKGKGGPTSDLTAEADKRGTLLQSGGDPAKSPKKSGQGYKDSSKYTAEKADDDFNDDDEDDKPSYFKKKKKKMKKYAKSEEDFNDDDEDEGQVDATEFMEGMENAVEDLGKSVRHLNEGMAVFGELLNEMADPRRDNLFVTMAKAIGHISERLGKIEKSVTVQADLVKAISSAPSAPRVAGMTLVKGEAAVETTDAARAALTEGDRNRLFKAATEKRITSQEHRHALRTGDLSILEKA